jgi:hypothetical protein
VLFYDVGDIEAALQPLGRKASSEFFLASSSMCQVFMCLEAGEFDKAQIPTLGAILHLDNAAKAFHGLAQMIEEAYPWLEDAANHVSFEQAAREVGLSPDSEIVQEMISQLVRSKLNGVLRSCAKDIGALAKHLLTVHDSVRDENASLDLIYTHVNALMSNWRTLIICGQFVSSVCRSNTRGIASA